MTALGRLAALVALALAADLGLAAVASLTGLPVAVDCLGSALAGALGGGPAGLLAGLASGGAVAWIVPGAGPPLPVALVHGLMGVAGALASRIGALVRPGSALAAGAAAGLVTATVLIAANLAAASVPVAAFLLGSGRGATLLLTTLGVAAEVLDKAVTFLLVSLAVARLSRFTRRTAPGSSSGGDGGVAQVPGDS